MRHIYTNKEAKEIDTHAIHTVGIPSLVLMEKAAMTVAAVLMERENRECRILAVCGTGNNGGDGIAAARILRQQGYSAAVTVIGQTEHMTEETKKQMAIAVGCHVPVLPPSAITDGQFDIMLDAVFGIGLSREVEGIYEKILEEINHSGATIYALDVPSGIHAGTGAVPGTAVKADCTVTFGVNKIGLVLYPGCEYAGEVIVGDIGFPMESVLSVDSSVYLYETEDLKRMPQRKRRSHKGTFGKVLVVAGSETMSGACYLAARAAYSTGAGLVRAVSTENNRDVILSALPEALFSAREEISDILDWADAIVIGPGLGLSKEAEELMQYVLENSSVPTVIDGDGIRLCRNLTDSLSDNFILTPHLKEMSYLTGESVPLIQENILSAVKKAAGDWRCILAGKDARTIVSDGKDTYVNVSGNNGMATGGAGDVLSGIIAGLLAQRMEPFEAAKLGVYLHGLSGDIMAKEKSAYSLMASDIITGISRILSGIGGEDEERI